MYIYSVIATRIKIAMLHLQEYEEGMVAPPPPPIPFPPRRGVSEGNIKRPLWMLWYNNTSECETFGGEPELLAAVHSMEQAVCSC